MVKPRLHTQEMPAYLDKEVSSPDRDKFGHAHLAAALRGLIEDERHRPPYSVGLLGKWGTGKSTIKGLYLHHLKNDEINAEDGVKRRDRVHTVTFNAWKYGGETDIRKSLFRHIFLEIGGTHEEADRNLFKTVASTEFQRKPLREIWAEFVDRYALGLLIVGLFAVLFFILVALLAWVFGFSDRITTSASLVTSAGVVALLAQKFFSNLPILSIRKPVHITSAPSQTIEEFENLFLTQVRKFKEGRVCSGNGKNVRRIVVFIDDLDRLTADEMVSGLDGIRSLIEMASHEMPDDTGIVFVISCDEERVADALSKRRGYAELPAAVSNVQDARRYLDRIFQFRLEIPPFPKRDMRSFVLSLLTTEYSALQTDLHQRGIDELELVDRMIHPAVQNPRNAIQIVNLFAQSWWLGVLREHAAVGSENPGGLGEGVITDHPLTLAIVSVIRTDFPDFSQALQRKPRIFDYFIDRFIRPEPLETLPDEIREELTAFAADVPADGRWDIKPQHRGLRQFMSHTQDIRRPYSLQPFLALSQDPVSRKHGDKAVPIEEALRTSDVAALLDAVGLTGSAVSIPPDFGALIADLIDDLRSETPTIQDNVAFTVAQLNQRIPEKDRRRILGLVIRRAGDSDALRWRVGPSQLRALAPHAENEELRALGRSLIEDIAGEETKVVLPSLERPSLREGLDLTNSAATLVLEVMEKTDLPPQAQHQFGQWLLHRTVRIAGQSNQVPFSWLEQQLSVHEDILLPLIRDEYPRIIVEEFSRDEPEPLDLAVVTERVSSVFGHFFEQGTQTRAKLWDYLKSLPALRQPQLVALAFSKFAQWHDDADAEAAHGVFAALGLRLVQNGEDADAWPLDDEEALRDTFAGLAEARESISTDGISHMVRLAQDWSVGYARSQSATRIYSVIAKASPEQWAVLNEQWAERLFSDLPEACQRVLLTAANQEDAPNELRSHVASGIAPLCGPIELNNHQIAAFTLLLHLLDEPTLHASPFVEQVTQFIDDTVILITQNPNDYIVSKVRALSHNLDKFPTEQVQQLLDSFTQLEPNFLCSVYHEFSEKWPVPTSEGGTVFAAQELFNTGISALSNLGQSDEAIQLLKSLANLHSRTRLDQADNRDRLVAGAYALWSYDLNTAKDITGQYPAAKRTPEQLSGLIGQSVDIITCGGEVQDHLLSVLVREVGFASAEDSQAATATLLAQPPPQETDGSPDLTLALWAAAVSQHDPRILVDTLVSQDINDQQAVRLYHHVLDNVESLSDEHFIRVLQETLSTRDDREMTADAVVGSIEDVTKRLLTSEEQKRALCKAALSVFSEISKLERKATLAKLCTQFGLKNVVLDGEYRNDLPEEDLEIIEKYTGKIFGKI